MVDTVAMQRISNLKLFYELSAIEPGVFLPDSCKAAQDTQITGEFPFGNTWLLPVLSHRK